METLIVDVEHSDLYYEKKSLGNDRFRSAPSKTCRQFNCRTFRYGVGLLPRPKRTPSTPRVQSPRSPKSVLPVFTHPSVDSSRTRPIPIQIRRCSSELVDKRRSFSYSELWAGPTYSNSPPPASVPIPKFSFLEKRTVSLNFPAPDSAVDILEVSKSVPVSPTSSCDDSFHSTESATKTLCRLLNLELEIADN